KPASARRYVRSSSLAVIKSRIGLKNEVIPDAKPASPKCGSSSRSRISSRLEISSKRISTASFPLKDTRRNVASRNIVTAAEIKSSNIARTLLLYLDGYNPSDHQHSKSH